MISIKRNTTGNSSGIRRMNPDESTIVERRQSQREGMYVGKLKLIITLQISSDNLLWA